MLEENCGWIIAVITSRSSCPSDCKHVVNSTFLHKSLEHFSRLQAALINASISVKVNFLLLEFAHAAKFIAFTSLLGTEIANYLSKISAGRFVPSLEPEIVSTECFLSMRKFACHLRANSTNQFIQHFFFLYFAQCTCQPNSELASIEPTLNVKIKLKKYLILHSLLYRKT